MGKYYITTTAPYVNSEPHIGFALEIIQADVLARTYELRGDKVFFNTGTDEHGKKIYEKAVEAGKEVESYVDEYAAKFRGLKELLNLAETLHFSRTTDQAHIKAAQEIWQRVERNGYIRKGTYKAKYCVGCELEKQDSELVEGKCPLHPNKELELIEEENYFFCFAKLQEKLLEYYDRRPDFVIPAHRQKEIRNFVAAGLTDFSISRLKEKMPWGVPVPGDPDHVMYVWFDALTYYISALGWPANYQQFEDYWGTIEQPNGVQVAGKDNLRQQAAMWQAMLIAAELPPSKQIVIHGFITSNGMKISKSLGNTVDPVEYVNRYGVDALRYYLLAKIDPFEDSDFTQEKFEETYRADLQNGLGNLVSRIAAMTAELEIEVDVVDPQISQEIVMEINQYRFDHALQMCWQKITAANQTISSERIWELEPKKKRLAVQKLIKIVLELARDITPFLPTSAKKIIHHFSQPKITKMSPLFPRLT